ncbi:MAG: DUF3800 domain-containing protein [Deltaproteobacteria bacterium CG_4_8_14_3_um_filter_45_9]|nr:MAG: DUF3800 domain-containing protein [Deltaproteobacteria bacterium CG03_land_8_20_14_0_80_45_14]PIX23065.1 MAG: DUF3800 domain-containing protein [Deltaproteobacteria bacterium CG_4_8_14_3_um_filter_45_9]
MAEYNIYCDESCHLEHDQQPIMLLGAVWCPKSEVRRYSESIRELKAKFGARGELKWTKVSTSKFNYYLNLVKFFFSTPNLNFRCLVVDDKSKLNHEYFNQGSHDSFYYKMYFYLLRNILFHKNQYYIYLDMKDTRSQRKIDTLRDVLCNNVYDFEQVMIRQIQHIRSHESELLQLTDFLLGAVSYRCRYLKDNRAKLAVIQRICDISGVDLLKSTPPWEDKFNLFFFSPTEVNR